MSASSVSTTVCSSKLAWRPAATLWQSGGHTRGIALCATGETAGGTPTQASPCPSASLNDSLQSHQNLAEVDVILFGVSRSGKTPTCFYLCSTGSRRPTISLFQMTSNAASCVAARLAQAVRPADRAGTPDSDSQERRASSEYASIENCLYEVNEARMMKTFEEIRRLPSITKCIEEIAMTVPQKSSQAVANTS